MDNQTVLKIRDGIDIYLVDENILVVYFMNTRKKNEFRINFIVSELIKKIDGKKNIRKIIDELENDSKNKINLENFFSTLKMMIDKKIILEVDEEISEKYLSSFELDKFDRQINFFGDFLSGLEAKYSAQKKLMNSKILIFGCGSIGGWIAVHLAMLGVANFILVDGDIVEESDVSRHVFFKEEYIGISKVEALSNHLKLISKDITIDTHQIFIVPDTHLSDLISNSDFVINTADEPYIGYTSTKISRECIFKNKAHFVAGGFDAHLGSTGEIIIPGVTPCVDCYTNHFKVALKGWKPEKHPVQERHLEIGGLSSLALWSASFAAIEITKYLTNLVLFDQNNRSRGEFLFDSMSLDYLKVKKNPDCKTCGEII